VAVHSPDQLVIIVHRALGLLGTSCYPGSTWEWFGPKPVFFANITGHAHYWDSFCHISIFSQLGPLASFILFAGPISGPAPAFISHVVLVLRG